MDLEGRNASDEERDLLNLARGVSMVHEAPDDLWRTVAALDVTTVFGRFRIDADTGAQTVTRQC